MEQRAAILDIVNGKEVDEAAIPQLPEKANAIKRFEHTRDGKPTVVKTLKARYGHLVNNNTCVTKFNTLEALSEKYDKEPQVKKEPIAPKKKAADAKKTLPSTLTRRREGRGRGRDRTAKAVTGSEVKEEGAEDEEDAEMEVTDEATGGDQDVEVIDDADIDRDQIKYGEFGKPAHQRRSMVRSKLARKRSKSVGKNGFLNWHNMAASS